VVGIFDTAANSFETVTVGSLTGNWKFKGARGMMAAHVSDNAPPAPRVMMTREAFTEMLYERVALRLSDVAACGTGWTKNDLVKRIVRYISEAVAKSPNDEGTTWQRTVRTLVVTTLHSYGDACGHCPWFHDVDFGWLLGNVAWEMLQSREALTATWEEVSEFAHAEYQVRMEVVLLHNAIWVSVESIFKNSGKTLVKKIYKITLTAHACALEAALEDPEVASTLPKVETFMVKWIREVLERVWPVLQEFGSEHLLTEETASAFFKRLITPFEGHDFSCIPAVLLDHRGVPPLSWTFLQPTISVILAAWPMPKKRRQES